MYGENIVSHLRIALGEEIEDAERNAAVVARQGVDHATWNPARVALGNEILTFADSDTQGAGDCFHQLYAVVAVGSQVDALTPRVLDHHLVRRTIVDKPDKAALFFIHSSYTISSCHWHDMRSLWHYLQILHKDNILILQSKRKYQIIILKR